jgi:hypothetical protein
MVWRGTGLDDGPKFYFRPNKSSMQHQHTSKTDGQPRYQSNCDLLRYVLITLIVSGHGRVTFVFERDCFRVIEPLVFDSIQCQLQAGVTAICSWRFGRVSRIK